MKPPSTELFFYLLEIIPLKTNFKGGGRKFTVFLVWLVTKNVYFSLLVCTQIINYGPVKKKKKKKKKKAIVYRLDNILLDLELKCIDKLWVFRSELTVSLLFHIFFYFVLREISCRLSHGKIRLTLLRLSIPLPDTLTTSFLSNTHLCAIIVFICDLFVSPDDPLMS